MTRIVYDLAMLASLLLVSIGAGLQWGLPVGLMVGGGLMAAFTVLGIVLTQGR